MGTRARTAQVQEPTGGQLREAILTAIERRYPNPLTRPGGCRVLQGWLHEVWPHGESAHRPHCSMVKGRHERVRELAMPV